MVCGIKKNEINPIIKKMGSNLGLYKAINTAMAKAKEPHAEREPVAKSTYNERKRVTAANAFTILES